MDLYKTITAICAWNLYLRRENMFVAENFIRTIVEKYRKHTVDTDGGQDIQNRIIWGLKHYIHSSFEKSLMERVDHYIQFFISKYSCYITN